MAEAEMTDDTALVGYAIVYLLNLRETEVRNSVPYKSSDDQRRFKRR